MLRVYGLLLLICAAQRSFTMRVSDAERDEADYAWKTREALREYLNFLLGGLRREEVELGITNQDEDPVPLYSRHRPFPNFRLEGYGGPRGRDPEAIYRRLPDHLYGFPPETDELEKPQFVEKQSSFAVPPTDPRFFQTPLPIQNLGDGDPQYDGTQVTKRDPDVVTEDAEAAIKDLETIKSPGPARAFPSEIQTEEHQDYVTSKLIDVEANKENIILIALVAGCSTGVVAGVALLIYGFIKLQRNAKAAADVEYPAYGVTGPNKESTPTGDRRLAHSAQMYHYQLTKQQIIAMESNRGGTGERRGSISEADSDDDNEEGDYTVYECPGLAPTGEMEVKNPLFQDDPTPAPNNEPTETTTQANDTTTDTN